MSTFYNDLFILESCWWPPDECKSTFSCFCLHQLPRELSGLLAAKRSTVLKQTLSQFVVGEAAYSKLTTPACHGQTRHHGRAVKTKQWGKRRFKVVQSRWETIDSRDYISLSSSQWPFSHTSSPRIHCLSRKYSL